ncbi:cytidylate kinase [Bartonella henselae]|uniref:Cytidylate kinase n=3 Tax=Bartonella TaxID=773 RepID=KCY_BARHE|nr:(d)CMP kinase [Bartonella henselae]Q6G546.1 RecName: Full=Cytidylate kinase; Short=CK; AltName: Full=Cytidine monophosphate kinase; Short=CMP kinase [Bartonella henselae str. Houston-1]ATP11741.1 cytidylate kinase [Bartonella henselae]ETS09238.1 cytidylate kinase [Bartonella henselae JK 50]ETS09395.1 cytidylate kinase [Bartonella henselae JK 51]ETS09716.1 cytidylate kinase [Bartonella henselae JK 42]ETS12744.1 cytidylate kinase [Bartonella henselae JK 41]
MKPFVIAIDGPAASGKGTLARKIATHYHLHYLDTGLTYRGVAHALLQQKLALDDEKNALVYARELDFNTLNPALLSSHELGNAASKIAIIPTVRETLVAKQRNFAKILPGSVLDGRDIGTIVCPDADVKLYVLANVQIRAKRRYQEILKKGAQADYHEILVNLEQRDSRDITRKQSPLKQAKDAYLLDTSELSIEATFTVACALIDPIIKARIIG